jgi:hypothetical protein
MLFIEFFMDRIVTAHSLDAFPKEPAEAPIL